MPKFSKRFGIEKTQAELDFVDIDPMRDTRLFVDPFAISIREDAWSAECTDLILSFFQETVDSIAKGRNSRAVALLTQLHEPNETCLGLSSGRPQGRGVAGKQAYDIYQALATSEAAKSGELSELADCDLFIPGIGPDKISDITTNIIRGSLINYTIDQCKLHEIPLHRVPSGLTWNPTRLVWEDRYVHLPLINKRRIILVPKAAVRRRMSLDSQEYYNHHILNFLQAEHLEANTSLVEVLRNRKRRVSKVKLKEHYPFDKEMLFRITRDNPKILETYKTIKGAQGAPSNDDLDEGFDEQVMCRALIQRLAEIPPGDAHASEFHNLMVGALEFIFYPNLIIPKKEEPIHQGRKRIDITYTNAAREGFFYRVHTSHQIASNYVMVECKNYSSDVTNPELDQISGRFSVNKGKLDLLMSRSFDNRDLFLKRCRDTAQDGRGFVIPLVDDDMRKILLQIANGHRRYVDDHLDTILRRLIM